MNPSKRPTAAAATPAQRRRHGIALRQISLAACLAAAAPAGFALPQGEVPTFGEATVSRPAPGRMEIRQTTPRAGLDWTSFSIAAGERVVVQQPSRDAVLLNRVLGDDPSLIYGSLSSNGGVWLINPRGIVFGASSRIDVGSLVASTLAITQDDGASGRLQLGRGAGAGSLRADGDIRADGSVVLVAPQLDVGGRITAPRVGLAAASEVLVDLDGDGLVFFNMRNDALESRLQLLGHVRADGGVADLRAAARAGLAGTVLNLEGVVQARTLGVREGRIAIDGGASGITRIAGTLDAQGHGAGARGGDVLVQGDRILLDRGARIDASGTAGGGSVRVGGDFRGANADVRNAAMVSVRSGALLDASATDLGDAGRVIVWSDEATRFAGHAAARGGARGGDGGLVEVSGKAFLDYRGSANLTAPAGRFGTLLLDPTNILIEASAPDLNGDGTTGDDLGPGSILFAGPGVNSRITASALVTQLAAGNVELQASNDISVNAAVSSDSASSLTLRGGGRISISAPVTVGGDLTLSANDAGSATRNPAGAVTVGAALVVGGALTLSNNGGTGVHALGADLGASTLVFVGNGDRTAAATWTLNGNSTVGSDIAGAFPFTKAGTGTLVLAGTLSAATVAIDGGTLSLAAGSGNRLSDTAAVTVASGRTLRLDSASETIGTLNLAGTLSGTGTLTATTYALGAGATASAALGTGTLNVTGNSTLSGTAGVGAVNVNAGTFTLDAPGVLAGTASVTVAAGAGLAIGANAQSVGAFTSAGALAGSATLQSASGYVLEAGASVAANLGSGTLAVNGNASLAGTAAASSVAVSSGTLTLGAANRFTATPSATITGTLATAGNEALGALAGSGDVTLGGGTLSAGGAADSSFSGRILGSGNLRKTGSGTLQLSGASAYSGSTQVAQGVLRLTGDERLPDTTALTVDTGATLRADNSETVAQATIAGTLQGPGTLTAATHALNGGTVASGATLGAGTLTSTGSSQLAGRATAGTVQVNAGTLTLAATADRLDDNANVTVATGATLNLGASETVRSLTLAGTLDGLGFTLSTSDRATLQAGGLAHANLGSGLLVVSGNAQLVGTSAAATVELQAGTLSLAAAERLLDTASVTVASGATLSLAGAERVGTLALAGTLAGASRLDATTVTLQSGALVQSDVDASSLLVQGNATLQGQALVGTAQISAGTLTLAAPERISDTAALTLAAGATLQLGVHGETVASAALAGTLAGSGTLSAASYSLAGATVDANLGGGTLTSTGATALNGTAAASSVGVTAGTLTLGAANRLADAAALTVATGATLTLSGNDTVGSLSLSGTVGGSGTLTATGGYALAGGTLQASAALGAGSLASIGSSLLAGTAAATTVSVDNGTLALGSADRLADTAALTIAGGATLALGGNDRVGSLTLAGTLAGSGTLTAATYTLAGGTVGVPLGAGALSSSGGSRLNAAAGAATVTVAGGTLSTGGTALLADTAAVSVAPGATLRLGGTQTIGSLAGGGDVELGTATLTTGALASSSFDGRLLGSGSLAKAGATTTFSLGGTQTYTGATQVLQGTLRTTAAHVLPDAGALTVAAGATLELGGNDTVASLALAGRLAGTGTLSAATYALDGGTVDAPLGAGALSSQGSSRLNRSAAAGSVDVVAGTLTLGSGNLLDDAALLHIAAGATLVLNGNDRVGTVDAAGTITGTGQLSAGIYLLTGGLYELDLGDGAITSTGNSIFNGTSAATAVTVSSGQLALLRANTFSAQPAVTVGAGAAMTLAGNELFGSLAGDGALALGGATMVTGALGDSRFGGVVSGNGGSELRKVGPGVFTLAGNQGYTGTTRVDAGTLALEGTLASATIAVRGGTLALAGAERLADTATVTVASGATLALAGNETVGSLVLSGTLGGSGTLTAASTLLDGGTVDADLGPGALSSRALATLRGTSAATTLSVETGTLALAGAGRLVATPAVGVAAGAALSLGGNETVGALTGDGLVALGGATLSTGALGDASFGGTLAGAGGGLVKLGTGTVTLAGASTYTGTTRVAAGTLAVAGTLASQTLRVDAGTLALGSADRLADSATIAVAAGALMTLAGNDTVGALQLAGRLAGSGTLSAATYALDGATVDADLGRGALSSRGAARLAGRSEAGTLSVIDGTLTLAANGRLGALPATTVAAGATLAAAGDEAVGSLAAAGTLSGSGTLSAATYALDGATMGIALGGGALASRGLTRLERPSAADSIAVDAGTLTLQPAALLTALPAVTLAGGTTLALGSDQALGLLAGAGTVSLGAATLTTGARGDSSFAGALAGSGGLVKAGSSRFVLSGASPYTGATRVAGGTLAIDGTLASATLQVDAGTLALGAAERLADGATLAVARGAALTLAGNETVAALQLAGRLHGNGTLIAATYALDGAVVEAELGRGTLSSRGASRLDGRAGANSVAVDTGTLTLGAADRLVDDAAVAVATGATLALGGNDSVASLALAGTLAGSGTLTATIYALNGGQVLADLGSGRLSSSGSSTLAGRAAVGEVLVASGTLTLPATDRLSAAPAVNVAAGGALALGGAQTFGTLIGSGGVDLGNHELATGSGGDGAFAGVISGTGGLLKLGGGRFTLTGANTYTGPTTVAAGTLRMGDGGSSGSLASSGYQLTGRLVFERSDDATLAQPVAGSGSLTQAGSGRLRLEGGKKTYTGSTLVARGELATVGDEQLPDGSALRVEAPGRLALGGRERLQSLDAEGPVALAGDLTAADDLLLRGAVTVPGNQPLTLSGRLISATHDGNRWGSSVGIDARGRIELSSGRDAGMPRSLVLGPVTAPAGGRIEAGTLELSAAVAVGSAQLELVSASAATLTAPPPEAQGRQAAGLPISFGADEVLQSGGEIRVAAGGGLSVVVAEGASVRLLASGNEFLGALSVTSGAAGSAWTERPTPGSFAGPTQNYALQGHVRIAGSSIAVGGSGIEADLVSVSADRLTTIGDARIVARLPFDNTVGTAVSLPALTLELTPAAFGITYPYGQPGTEIRVDIGSRAFGNRTLPLDAGYLTVLPRGGASGSTAVLLSGPQVALGGYRFFFDGAGRQSEIPVFYNGLLPVTPAVENSISATVSVSESARRQRFEEAVRTENVALRLRAGVIAEVGPGRSATTGSQGLRLPSICPPAGASLGCGPAN
jgi:filamentous hemagglutinin family protein